MNERYRLANLDARAYLEPNDAPSRDGGAGTNLYALAGSHDGLLERCIVLLRDPTTQRGWAEQRLVLIGEHQDDTSWFERARVTPAHRNLVREMDDLHGRTRRPDTLHAMLPDVFTPTNELARERTPRYDPDARDLTSLDTLIVSLDEDAFLDPRGLPGHASSTPHPDDERERVFQNWRLTTATALALLIASGRSYEGPWAGQRIALRARESVRRGALDRTPTALALLERDPFFARALAELPRREPAPLARQAPRTPDAPRAWPLTPPPPHGAVVQPALF
jgi:hypothetical protein